MRVRYTESDRANLLIFLATNRTNLQVKKHYKGLIKEVGQLSVISYISQAEQRGIMVNRTRFQRLFILCERTMIQLVTMCLVGGLIETYELKRRKYVRLTEKGKEIADTLTIVLVRNVRKLERGERL